MKAIPFLPVVEQDRWPQSRRCGGGGGGACASPSPLPRDHPHLGVNTLCSGAGTAWWRPHLHPPAAPQWPYDLWPLPWPPHMQFANAHLSGSSGIHWCANLGLEETDFNCILFKLFTHSSIFFSCFVLEQWFSNWNSQCITKLSTVFTHA